MRVRIALGLAVLATAIGLVIDMSGSAPRLAGDDHVSWPARDPGVAAVPGGGVLCMHATVLPDDAARIVMPIHDSLDQTKRLPRIAVEFTDSAGKPVATGVLARGAVEGPAVSLPLRYPHGPSALGSLCLHVGGQRVLVVDGEIGAGTTTASPGSRKSELSATIRPWIPCAGTIRSAVVPICAASASQSSL